jgi:pimeloyl-ACP methyl ester carboxylesterase
MAMKWLGLVVAALAWADCGAAAPGSSTLERRADPGFATVEEGASLRVATVNPGSAAARAGIRDGDRLVAIDGARFVRPYEGAARLQRLRGGRPLVLAVVREGRETRLRFTPPPLPLEADADLDLDYGALRTGDGAHLRTIVSRPAGSSAPLPALFFVQWVSCGSIEGRAAAPLKALARRAGMALIRVERAGAGDSLGPACYELDYDTELRHYREALDALRRHPWVDSARIVVYGSSLGATLAPLVAQDRPVAGLLVQGGGALTYAERMIGFDRLFLERSGVAPDEIDRRMRESIAFHAEYLLRGKTPERIARERPDLAGVWARTRGTGDGVHYGRPYAWHQQAAAKDFLAAWAAIEAPVFVVYGEYDQFETRHGHALIVETLNRLRPGSATLLEIAKADHELELYASAQDAYAYRDGRAAPELFLEPAAAWLKRIIAAAR